MRITLTCHKLCLAYSVASPVSKWQRSWSAAGLPHSRSCNG